MNKNKIQELIELVWQRDQRAFAKAITIIENKEPGWIELLNPFYKSMTEHALVIGITGAGGVGKSTLIDKIIRVYREQNKIVGVIAVDPSSPYTGGSFLGDRVRMGTHNTDPGVFIRSFGSRGAMGGISQGIKNVLYIYKNFNFDVIIIESLGIGQDETEITNFVDVTVVTLVPGFGDAMQMAKAGVQEIADICIVNKADKPDAEEFLHQLESSLSMVPEERRPVILKTVAIDNTGVEEVVKQIHKIGEMQIGNREQKAIKRIKMEIESETSSLLHKKIMEIVDRSSQRVFLGDMTPFELSKEIVNQIVFKEQEN